MPLPVPTVLIDTREQTPWCFTLPTVRGTVPTGGDYSIVGFEALICIERKSLDDLVSSLTIGRERFGRSIAALRTRPYRALIVEAEFPDVLAGRYRSRAHPNSIVGSLCAIMADGTPAFFAGNPAAAAAFAERLLLKFHKRALAAAAQETAA